VAWAAKSQPSSPQRRTKHGWSEQSAALQVPLVCQKPHFPGSIKQKPSAAPGFLFPSFWLVRWISTVIATAMAAPMAPNPSPAEILCLCSTAWGHQSFRRAQKNVEHQKINP